MVRKGRKVKLVPRARRATKVIEAMPVQRARSALRGRKARWEHKVLKDHPDRTVDW